MWTATAMPTCLPVGDWSGDEALDHNDNASFKEQTIEAGFNYSQGFYGLMKLTDVDGDGNLDVIAGNLGENCRLEASPQKPMALFVNDFDGNSSTDPILCSYWGDTLFPHYCDWPHLTADCRI